jgi:hypothetical protein
MRRIALAAVILMASAGLAHPAEQISEVEFRKATIRMDAKVREPMRDVETLIACLNTWSPGEGKRDNKVEIIRTGADRFTISAPLRSATNMYFEVMHEYNAPIAVLRRLEYKFPDRNAYQQVTDAETKRAALHSACPSL